MNRATICRLAGPVVHARTKDPFSVNEAITVGQAGLLGEVIRLEGDEIVAQVYEDTAGLRPGDAVIGRGLPLSVRLGPALLGRIFDGLLRPLGNTDDPYVHPGMPELPPTRFTFRPRVEKGRQLDCGMPFGEVRPEQGRPQVCLVPPDARGRVTFIADEGEYADDETVCTVETPAGEKRELAMSHLWPVRVSRPVAEWMSASRPMVTGQRVLDTLFPVARGGKAALPGGFGTGKTVLQEALAKHSDPDIIVYVGCGERGNEMAGVLHEFPELEDPRTGRPLMERTVIISNTSNMPVAAREAGIYTGVTVAEYFRDQGLHVALMADSTSRWAEALREISGRLGELPAEGGYPAYLSSRLASFYERAALVRTLGGAEGSLTIIGAVSPPSGDFSEPVTTHTKRFVRCFWALDQGRAQARIYPAIHPLRSYSEDTSDVETWWKEQGNPGWAKLRRRLLVLLEEQARLERMARIVGMDALPPEQQLKLLAADLVNEGFLSQSAFSETDRYCSPRRQTVMMHVLSGFIDQAEIAVGRGVPIERIRGIPSLRRLRRMGEEYGEDRIDELQQLGEQLDREIADLGREERNAG